MKRTILIFILFVISIGASFGVEYNLSIDDTLTHSGYTIVVKTIAKEGVVFDVSGEQSTIFLNKPKNFTNLYIIPKEIYYQKDKDERFAIIDFCQIQIELCNNRDDDCDSRVDDNLKRDCGIDTGICQKGVQRCNAGEWGYCQGVVYSQEEICNNLDDDCDGVADENLTRACGNSFTIGNCRNSVQSCEDGRWSECSGVVYPIPEVCNGIDDDCDGKVDEDITKSCIISDGLEVKTSTISCNEGEWEECKGKIQEGRINESGETVKEDEEKKGLFQIILTFLKNMIY